MTAPSMVIVVSGCIRGLARRGMFALCNVESEQARAQERECQSHSTLAIAPLDPCGGQRSSETPCSPFPYSSYCLEGEFSEVELPIYGVLRSSFSGRHYCCITDSAG